MGAADNFGFPELVPDPEREELFDPVTHIRYCFLMTNVAKAVCDSCRSTAIQKFGTRTRSYRDLPKLQDRTVLVIKRQRFRCLKKKGGCGRVFYQGIAGLDSRRSMTTRCLEWIRANCLYLTNQQAADQIGCNIRTFWDISNQRIEELKKRFKPYLPLWLGIDETSLNGNIDESCCVLVDLEKRKPVDMLPNRRKETVYQWFKRFSSRSAVRGVAMDMYENYRDVVKELLPNAEIVIDRFHVERWANRAVDKVRIKIGKRIQKRFPKEWNAEEWKQNSRLLRKSRHQIPDKDDPDKKEKHDKLIEDLGIRNFQDKYDFFKWLAGLPDIATVFYLKEAFCDIYGLKRRYAAKVALEKWEKSVPAHMREPFKTVLNATNGWNKEFLAFFPSGMTNGYTEAFNSVVKRINRAGNGYTFDVLRARLLFGRKPKHKTVKLKPPLDLDTLRRKMEDPPDICLNCGQEYDDDVDDEEDGCRSFTGPTLEQGVFCPLCRRPMDMDVLMNHLQPAPRAERFSTEYYEDLSVGDLESAARFKALFCDYCLNPFDSDQLHDYIPSNDAAEDSPPDFPRRLCTGCLEKFRGPREASRIPDPAQGLDERNQCSDMPPVSAPKELPAPVASAAAAEDTDTVADSFDSPSQPQPLSQAATIQASENLPSLHTRASDLVHVHSDVHKGGEQMSFPFPSKPRRGSRRKRK